MHQEPPTQNTTATQHQLLLTCVQYTILQKLLPQNFSLTVSNKNTRLQTTESAFKEPNPVQNSKDHKVKRRAYAEAENTIKGSSDSFKRCHKILGLLKKHQYAPPFLVPVDPVALGIPTYFEVIKTPMDLSTVELKLKNMDYDTPEQFEEDIRLIWSNAMLFNSEGTQIYSMADALSRYFENLLLQDIEALSSLKQPTTQVKKVKYENDDYKPVKSHKIQNPKPSTDKPLTYNEKKALSQMIRLLSADQLWGVWNIVSQGDATKASEELEFDIDMLPAHTARELEKYVKSKVSGPNKKKAGESIISKKTSEYREDTKSEPKETAPQPNVKINNNEVKNKDVSESSFISDLEDSD